MKEGALSWFVILISAFPVFSQGNTGIHHSTSWLYDVHGALVGPGLQYRIFIDGDTVYDDNRYAKVYMELLGSINYVAAVKDSINRRYVLPTLSRVQVPGVITAPAMDFNVTPGEIVVYSNGWTGPNLDRTLDSALVLAVEEFPMNVGGRNARKVIFDNEYWIEQIGSANFFDGISSVYSCGGNAEACLDLNCFSKQGYIFMLNGKDTLLIGDCLGRDIPITLDQPVSTGAEISVQPLTVFPNPGVSHVTIEVPGAEGALSVVNMAGQLIEHHQALSNFFRLNIQSYPKGIYVVEWNSDRVYRAKLVVQ